MKTSDTDEVQLTSTRSRLLDARPRVARLIGFFIPVLAGASLSLAMTGFTFGVGNNLFHLPILARLFDEQQFQSDEFTQSLRYYSTGFWWLFAGSARVFDLRWLLFVLAFLSRALTFAAFLSCASILGVRTFQQRALFSVLLSLSGLMRGDSFAGSGGLFIATFTHSEIGNGLILFGLYFAIVGRLELCLVFVGLTFFMNAFMAVWTVVPIAFIVAMSLHRRTSTPRDLLVRSAVGGAIAAVIAIPVLQNIASNPTFMRPVGFDYVQYLREYFPDHFLFGPISKLEKFNLACVLLVTGSSLWSLGRLAQPFLLALCGFMAVYCLGIAAPVFSHSPAILNLHLLRSSVAFHLLSSLGAVTLTTLWMTEGSALRKIAGPILAVVGSVTTIAPFLFIPIVLVTRARSVTPRALATGLSAVASILLAVLVPYRIWQGAVRAQGEESWAAEWKEVGVWGRLRTPTDAVFIVPTDQQTAGLFSLVARRVVWVDWKRGAAAMWYPPYYRTWRTRMAALERAATLPDKLTYARAQGVEFVIAACPARTSLSPAFRTARLCVFRP